MICRMPKMHEPASGPQCTLHTVASLGAGTASGVRMPFTVEVDPDSGLIRLIYDGVVTQDDVVASTDAALANATGDGPHLFLSDFMHAEARLNTTDLYSLPDLWVEALSDRRNKFALVVPQSGALWADARFCETTWRNRGWSVRAFPSRGDAEAWLLGKGDEQGEAEESQEQP